MATRERTKPRNAFENFGDFFLELLSKIAGPLVKKILTTLRITAAVSVIDARIKKKTKKNMVLMLAVEFKTKLGFNPFDPIKRKGQSVLTK